MRLVVTIICKEKWPKGMFIQFTEDLECPYIALYMYNFWQSFSLFSCVHLVLRETSSPNISFSLVFGYNLERSPKSMTSLVHSTKFFKRTSIEHPEFIHFQAGDVSIILSNLVEPVDAFRIFQRWQRFPPQNGFLRRLDQ